MASIEEIISIPVLNEVFAGLIKSNRIRDVMEEIISQSKVEFNYVEGEVLDDPALGSPQELEDAINGFDE